MKKAFTLIELMVTVSIISLMLSFAIPKYDEYILKGRFDTEASIFIKVLATAQEQYKQEFGFYYPYSYKDADEFMSDGNQIQKFLRVDLNTSNNFLYSISTNTNGDNYIIRATLSVGDTWAKSSCEDNDRSTRRCLASTIIPDTWVSNYSRGLNKHYIEYSYPIKNTNSNINGIDYTNLFKDN